MILHFFSHDKFLAYLWKLVFFFFFLFFEHCISIQKMDGTSSYSRFVPKILVIRFMAFLSQLTIICVNGIHYMGIVKCIHDAN